MIKRLMVKMGMHGKSHMRKFELILEWSHNNGLGA